MSNDSTNIRDRAEDALFIIYGALYLGPILKTELFSFPQTTGSKPTAKQIRAKKMEFLGLLVSFEEKIVRCGKVIQEYTDSCKPSCEYEDFLLKKYNHAVSHLNQFILQSRMELN
jgi:hypothetical protein